MEGRDIIVPKKIRILTWSNLILIGNKDKLSVYSDGELLGTYHICWDNICQENRLKLRNGSIVLGQDQNEVRGAFKREWSLSGKIAKFEIFNGYVMEDPKNFSRLCDQSRQSDIDMKQSSWKLSNVLERKENLTRFCQDYNSDYSLFLFQLSSRDSTLCGHLGGSLIDESDAERLAALMNDDIETKTNYSRQVIVHLKHDNPESLNRTSKCNAIRFKRENDFDEYDYYISTYMCSLPQAKVVCRIPKTKIFKLKGLPSSIETHLGNSFVPFHKVLGETYLLGFSCSRIMKEGSVFLLTSWKNNVKLSTMVSQMIWPIGRREWFVEVDNRTIQPLSLTLSFCRDNEFTCDSGECIKLEKRCDVEVDCEDKSDEFMCSTLRIEKEKRFIVGQKPEEGQLIGGDFQITCSSTVDVSKSSIMLYFKIVLKWTDSRLELYNLQEGLNLVPLSELETIWRPSVILYPLKDGSEPRARKLEVLRNSESTPSLIKSYEGWFSRI